MTDDLCCGDHLTLSELTSCVRLALRDAFPDSYRVVAEIAEMRSSHAGHSYLTLVERDDDSVVAQISAIIWADNRAIIREFREETGSELQRGMQVLFTARVSYHDVYGLKLCIDTLDADYTVGQMARQRRAVIERLRSEDRLERNRSLDFPLVPQRIAVVSSGNAAGYQDFVDQLERNPRAHRFTHALFNAVMQGDACSASVIAALRRVCSLAEHFDLVVLVRGGGSQVDLSAFDGYEMAREIADMPLPVVTGIGHERDDTVADLVAHTRVKTPTAAAEMLVARCEDFEDTVLDAWSRIRGRAIDLVATLAPTLEACARRLIASSERRSAAESAAMLATSHRIATGVAQRTSAAATALSHAAVQLHGGTSRRLALGSAGLDVVRHRMDCGARAALDRHVIRVDSLEQRVVDLDPRNVLRRGYSITRLGGRALRDAADARPGDTLETDMHRGRLRSAVFQVEEPDGRG